jgi:two-component system, chemotaxis family, sensor kinase CheA
MMEQKMNLAANITKEDIGIFLQEAEEVLQLLDEDIVKLEKEDGNADLLNEIFRAAHTLKGSSAMLGHQRMSKVAHAMESILEGLRKGTLKTSPLLVDALLNSLDVLKQLKEELITSEESDVDIATIVANLESAARMDKPGTDSGQATRTEKLVLDNDSRSKLKTAIDNGRNIHQVNVSIDKTSSWAAVRCFQIVNELSQLGEIVCSAPSQKEIEEGNVGFDLELVIATQSDASITKKTISVLPDISSAEIKPFSFEEAPSQVESQSSSENKSVQQKVKAPQTVRIDVTHLDSLMEQIGELVVNRNRINQLSRMLESKYRGDDVIDDLGKTSVQTGKIVNTLQQDIMKIRMLPIEIVFNGFPRMVRDLARKAGKDIEFIVEGQETEVDRSVIEHIKDPLVHLLRNSVDHGIETAAKRKTAGKSSGGVIKLSAYHEQNHICITVEDDGKGIDPNVIRNSAVKKGFIKSDEAERLTDSEAIDLMFLPGLSTAEKTTEVSGRGVGMDVVKTNINSLNGTVQVDSAVGRGTKFTLKLPLTLAILPSLLISVGKMLYAIPLANIVETAKLIPEDLKTIRGQLVITSRDTILPVIYLSKALGWSRENDDNHGNKFVVIVKSGDMTMGLIVDSLIEQQEIVIKSLGNFFGGIKGVAGASILGDGRVALIIDIANIIQSIITDNRKNRKENLAFKVQ